MTNVVYGIVINLNAFGATVRLDSGELASAPAGDVEAHRQQYERALTGRKRLAFVKHDGGKRPMVMVAPQIVDEDLDEQIAQYLKSTEEWESQGGIPAHERHFLQKKKRAALFQSKHET